MRKFKLIKQHDQKDCGVACLAMILHTYGSIVPISKLRLLSGTDCQGTSAYGLVKALETLRFESTVFKTDSLIWNDKNISYPLIAHIIVNTAFAHYVVVYGKRKNNLLIADPWRGKFEVTPEVFAHEWTGVILTMHPNTKYKPLKNSTRGIFSFLPLLVSHKRLIFLIVILSLVLTVLGIVSSYYLQIIIDRVAPHKSINLLNIISTGLLTMYLVQSVFQYLKQRLLIMLGQSMGKSIMLDYLNHVLHLPMSFFATRKSGEIISRFLDASKIIDALASSVLSLFIDTTMVILVGLILFLQNHLLFMISLITIPCYTIIVFTFLKPFNRTNEDQMEAGSMLNSQIIECLRGIETIKSFNATDKVYIKIEKQFRQLMIKSFKSANLDNIQSNLKLVIQSVGSTLLLWVGTKLVIEGQLSIGQLMTYNALMAFFVNPLQNIINLQVKVQTAKVANDRLNEIFYLDQETLSSGSFKHKYSLKLADKTIAKFDNVSFSYGFSENVLNNISLSIMKNEKVAIVGMSGSGKSTLVKLLMNFYTATDGKIFFKNENINEISRDNLRSSISYVSQETFFFSGTIMENLVFGLEAEPTITQVSHACEIAQIRTFIEALPLQYQSPIEESANNLSGGQKQRLAIARGLLKQSDVLVLDEATSGLDTYLEHLVIRNLLTMKDKTIIFLAHRLTIAKKCDQILVLQKGSVVESGNHQQLMDNKGLYKRMWEITYM